MNNFLLQPTVVGQTLQVRAMVDDDFDGLYAVGCDPKVWAGHPATNRYQKEHFDKWFEDALASKALTIQSLADGRIMGSSRFYSVNTQPAAICIGYTFLGIDYWGGAANKEMKHLMLSHAFAQYEDVWFHIGPENIRSKKATAKIGAQYIRDEKNSLSNTGAIWSCYQLTKSDWIRLQA